MSNGTTFKYLLWNYFYLELSYFSGFPVVNDPLYNHVVFGPEKGKGGRIGKSDEKLIEVHDNKDMSSNFPQKLKYFFMNTGVPGKCGFN